MARAAKTGSNNPEKIPAGQSPVEMQQAILNHLHSTLAKPLHFATPNDWYMATAHAVRDRMVNNWMTSFDHLMRFAREKIKVVSYLSSEFLLGPHLGNNLVNLYLAEPV